MKLKLKAGTKMDSWSNLECIIEDILLKKESGNHVGDGQEAIMQPNISEVLFKVEDINKSCMANKKSHVVN